MAKINVGINGFGRIGRNLFRIILDRQNQGELENINLVAINNPGNDKNIYAHLLKYDSVGGRLNQDVSIEEDKLVVGDKKYKFFSHKNPAEIDWSEENVDVVVDASGRFRDGPSLSAHIKGSVKKVILCAPGKNIDATFVYGINHEFYNPEKDHVISNASCTTNCLAPVAKILNDNIGIESGLMTTVHAYTSDQNLLDNSHSDYRRSRAAALSMIPTSTGAAAAIGLVIPELKGKLDGYAVRVPTPNVSLVDLSVNFSRATTIEEINGLMKEASEGSLKGVLGYETNPLVSVDFVGRSESSVFDPDNTKVIDKFAKVVCWYDNEFGFSNRVLDLANYIATKE